MIAPIIIVGMHRSGTTMIAQLLKELGVFMGAKQEQNAESLFFLKINRWLLQASGGDWDYPEPFAAMLENCEIRNFFTERARRILNSPRLIEYLGITNYFKYRFLGKLEYPWGWKDPRNSFTLPIWLELFPKAKVIHIMRHGVDVADSLRRREHLILDSKRNQTRVIRNDILPTHLRRQGFDPSVRCYGLEGSFRLWELYVAAARSYCEKQLPNSFSFHYEDFVQKPDECLSDLISFLSLKCANDRIAAVCKKVQPDRIFAYRENPTLQTFGETVRERLAVYGY